MNHSDSAAPEPAPQPSTASPASGAWCDVDSATERYASRFAGPIGEWLLQVQRDALCQLLTLPAGSTVLDLGGGHAQLIPILLDAGYNVTLHGSCPQAQGRAARYVAQGECRWTEGPLDKLPHGDESFDAVISFRILSHVADWHVLIREMCRVARQMVILDYPSLESVNRISAALFGLKQQVEKTTRPFTVFHDADVRTALIEAGCVAHHEVRQYLFPMAAHRALQSPRLSGWLENVARASGLTARAGSPVVIRGDKRHGPKESGT